MVISVAVWSIAVRPGERESVIPQGDLRITNVALGDELSDKSGRTTVKFTYLRPVNVEDSDEDDEETEIEGAEATTVLCSLIPGTIEQATVDVTLEADEEFLFEVVGKNTVYLTGNYIDQSPDNVPFNDDSEMEDEDEFDLRDVSSDVELNPDELDIPSDDDADRFEEVHDDADAPKSLKRPRASDVIEADEPAEGKLSKAQQKKANKKLKAESGAAVPSGSNTKAEAKASEDAKKDKKEKEKKEKKEKVDGKGVEKDVEKAANEGASAMKELPGGLKVKDVKTGTGPQAKKGQTVHMRYIGKLQNGKTFDSNTKGKPFSFQLGQGQVIKGWDMGIQGMQVGGERLLIIPPNLGYGKTKNGPIPANSALTFECKLVDLK